VHKSRVDEVVKGLSARLEKVKLGYGLDKGTTMGPLHSPAQKAFVDSLIKEAKESGAKVLEFGELPGGDMKGGNFVRPAIVVNPSLNLRVVTEEQFGPTLPVIPFDDEEDAIAIGNDVAYGLAAGVWTENMRRAFVMADRLQAGTVWVNTYRALSYLSPFGGYKRSGLGRESGQEMIKEYLQVKSVWISTSSEVPNPFIMSLGR
jgi:acyl-CoA reductase-like NAD-dependent aldehyde dehydrogenase